MTEPAPKHTLKLCFGGGLSTFDENHIGWYSLPVIHFGWHKIHNKQFFFGGWFMSEESNSVTHQTRDLHPSHLSDFMVKTLFWLAGAEVPSGEDGSSTLLEGVAQEA